MADYSLVAAIASAIAAVGSVGVAYSSYCQQKVASRASDIDKNIDRLIALALRANSVFSVAPGNERKFNQLADFVNILNSAYCRIKDLERKLNLTKTELDDIADYFTDHLSYEIIKAMRGRDLPEYSRDGTYSINSVFYIESLWVKLYGCFFRKNQTENHAG